MPKLGLQASKEPKRNRALDQLLAKCRTEGLTRTFGGDVRDRPSLRDHPSFEKGGTARPWAPCCAPWPCCGGGSAILHDSSSSVGPVCLAFPGACPTGVLVPARSPPALVGVPVPIAQLPLDSLPDAGEVIVDDAGTPAESRRLYGALVRQRRHQGCTVFPRLLLRLFVRGRGCFYGYGGLSGD